MEYPLFGEIPTFSARFNMNPRSKGWLAAYVVFRKSLLIELTGEGNCAAHPEFSLYKILQPTGLMYGQPITPFAFSEAANWKTRDRVKILLAEGLISSALLYHEKSVTDAVEFDRLLEKTIENVNAFYQQVFPELGASSRTLLGRRKEPLELAEQILERRAEHLEQNGNFWTRFFNNSLGFLDIFIFGQWIHMHADRVVSDFFHYEREELRTAVVRVMAVAAHANRVVAFEERKLLEFFLQGAGLSPERRKECRDIFEHGLDVEDLDLPTNNSWILKKYFLEMAILTFWSDRKMDQEELDLLDRFATTMGFHHDDIENSLLAVEGFVLEHWKELDSLQDKRSFEEVSQQFIQRMAAMALKGKGRLLEAARQNADLMNLLRRARSSELDAADKEALRAYLREVLGSIPALSVITLPPHFLTLPALMQIFPKDFVAEVIEGAA